VTGLRWEWIAVMAIVPPIGGVLAALPVWRTGQMILGNLAGSIVILGSALALIVRESIEIRLATAACLDAGFTCFPTPSAFARYAIYASLGMLEVFALFLASLSAEDRMRRRHYDPQWR